MFELINPNYKETKFYEVINKFYASPIYIAIVALVALLSNLFGLEGCALIFYMFISAFIPLLFTDNLNPLITPVFFGYITVSKVNNFSDYGITDNQFVFSLPKLEAGRYDIYYTFTGKDIVSRFDLPDRRGDKRYKSWDANCREIEKAVNAG